MAKINKDFTIKTTRKIPTSRPSFGAPPIPGPAKVSVPKGKVKFHKLPKARKM